MKPSGRISSPDFWVPDTIFDVADAALRLPQRLRGHVARIFELWGRGELCGNSQREMASATSCRGAESAESRRGNRALKGMALRKAPLECLKQSRYITIGAAGTINPYPHSPGIRRSAGKRSSPVENPWFNHFQLKTACAPYEASVYRLLPPTTVGCLRAPQWARGNLRRLFFEDFRSPSGR